MIKSFTIYLAHMKKGTFIYKILGSIIPATILGTFYTLVNDIFNIAAPYIFQKEFVMGFLILLFGDMITGLWKHAIKHTVDFREFFLKTILKTWVCIVGYATFMVLANMKGILGKETIILVSQLSVFAYLGVSVFSNLFIITGGKYPPVAFMNRLKNFQNSGDIKDLT